ncbi:MAG: serine protein kinase RIO [Candidatus Bathyarchaeia archaeon]
MIKNEKKLMKKLEVREKRYEVEQLFKEKRSEEMEALEEVFDKTTLMTVYDLLNKGYISKIFGAIEAGKESKLYWGLNHDGNDLAIKIYLSHSTEFKKGRLIYIEGDPRFTRIRKDTRSLVYLWAQKEFKNLKLAQEAGVRVPKPIFVEKNVLLMEFVGENGIPAPLLKETSLKNPAKVYKKLIDYVKLLYEKAKLIHGDLSEYNVMIWKNRPVLFDVSQAVLIEHPLSDYFLKRDIVNLNNHFQKYGIKVKPIDELYRWVIGHG